MLLKSNESMASMAQSGGWPCRHGDFFWTFPMQTHFPFFCRNGPEAWWVPRMELCSCHQSLLVKYIPEFWPWIAKRTSEPAVREPIQSSRAPSIQIRQRPKSMMNDDHDNGHAGTHKRRANVSIWWWVLSGKSGDLGAASGCRLPPGPRAHQWCALSLTSTLAVPSL